MRDLAKSALTFPWAVSVAGVQQLVNLVAPPAEGRLHGARTALDDVTRPTEGDLDGWLDELLETGETLWRHAVDLATTRPPSLNSSGLLRMATAPRLAPLFQVTSDYGLLSAARLDALRLGPDDRPAAMREFQNKLEVIQQFAQLPRDMNLAREDDTPIAILLDRAAALPPGRRLAAVEAVGTFAGRRATEDSGGDPQDVLTDEAATALPAWSLTMLHAGVGVAFANAVLASLTPSSSVDRVRHAVTRFSALSRRSSRRGYVGAALESFGMVARLLHQDLVPQLDREIRRADPDMRGYFWHGAGRAIYFDATTLLPSLGERRQVLVQLRREAQDNEAYGHALAGFAWAMTLANLQSPEVMEQFFRRHAVPTGSRHAFANGVSSAIVVQHDTMPGDTRIGPFVSHAPHDEDVAEAWRPLVTTPCQVALDRTYGELQQTCALGLLFHARPTPA